MQKVFDSAFFRDLGHKLVDKLADYLQITLSKQSDICIPWQPSSQMLEYWEKNLNFSGSGNIYEFLCKIIDSSVHIHDSRYMGHQVGMVAPVAALAGLVSDLLNNGMAVYEMGLSSVPLERIICQYFAKLYNLPSSADGFMTSGGTLSNITAMLTARQIKAEEDVWTLGQKKQKMAIMVSNQAHYCIERAVKIMGWGEKGIIKVPTDSNFKIKIENLEPLYKKAKIQGIKIIALVGSACSTATGSFDNLRKMGEFAKEYKLWFHIDAAHGGAAILSPKYAHLLDGTELADSITIDFHKMMMIPALASALLYRNSADSYKTFAQKADYLLSNNEDWQNPAARTFECSKFMMVVKIASLIHAHGLKAIKNYVETCFDNGKKLANLIKKEKNFELATEPQCNIVCFRLVYSFLSLEDTNRLNYYCRKQIVERGEYYILTTQINGKTFFRVSLMNYLTEENEFKGLISQIKHYANLWLKRQT